MISLFMQVDLTKEYSLIERLEECNLNLEDKAFCKKDNRFEIRQAYANQLDISTIRHENLNGEFLKLHGTGDVEIISSFLQEVSGCNLAIYSIKKFSSKNFDAKNEFYYKLVIPVCDSVELRLNDYFGDALISVNNRVFNGIEFEIDECKFSVFFDKTKFVINCKQLMNYQIFDVLCRKILAAFGFVTGYVPMGRGYYFANDNFENSFVQFLFDSTFYKTYKADSLLTVNPYDFYSNVNLNYSFDESNRLVEDHRIAEIKQKLKPLSKFQFESLVSKMSSSDRFSQIIFNYLSINQVKSLDIYLKAGLWLILLEMVTGFLKKELATNDVQHTVNDNFDLNDKQELTKQLHKVAMRHYKKNGVDYKGSLTEKRIDGVNSPLNSMKLTEPYELLGIPLTDKDKRNIKLRNKYLHGSIPFKEKDIEVLSERLFCTSLEFKWLVSALIYKFIGFDGVLKNNAKIYLDYKNIEELSDDGYFKELD